MDREQLAARHTDVIRRHWRALTDTGGQPGPALLGELAAIAEEHAVPDRADIEAWIRRDPQAFEREIRRLMRIHGTSDLTRITAVAQRPGGGSSVADHLGVAVAEPEPAKATTAKPATARKPAARRTTTRRSPK